MAQEIAQAYVHIIPTTKGIKEGIKSELGSGTGAKLGRQFAAGFGKTALVAIGAAATAAGALVKSAVSGYAEFEQLTGGAELLFGEAFETVAQNAAEAYKTVQMSQSDYLRQVNGLSTGLKTALGGDAKAAAELADRVVTAEADVVAATGAAQEDVQNAFNGIMKSNFTMLDNLQLGITPTKAGFQEMIDKVNDWRKANGKAGDYVIDNLADCQSALVDYIEMQGLAGYAAMEAGDTISGSLSSAKAAWDNLITGMADSEADMGELVDNFAEAASGAVNRLIPVITQALEGAGQMVAQMAPVLSQQLPGLIAGTMPALLQAGGALLEGLISGLITAVPSLIGPAMQVIQQLGTFLIENLPALIEAGMQILLTLANGISESLPALIPAVIDVIFQVIDTLIANAGALGDAAVAIIEALGSGLIAALPRIVEKLPQIVTGIVNALVAAAPKLIEAGIQLFMALVTGLPEIIAGIVAAIPQILEAICQGLADLGGMLTVVFSDAWEKAKTVFEPVGDWFGERWADIQGAFATAGSWFSGKFAEAKAGVEAGFSGIGDWFSSQWETTKSVYAAAGSWFSEKFAEAKTGITGAFSGIGAWFKGIWEEIKSAFSFGDAANWGRDMIDNFISGVKSAAGALGEAVSDVAGKVRAFFHFSEPDVGPLSDFHTYAPDMIELFARGVEENTGRLVQAMRGAAGAAADAFDLRPAPVNYGTGNLLPAGGTAAGWSGSVVINVYAAPGMDEKRVADMVMDRLTQMTSSRRRAIS